jgi:hypothetical protein
MMGSSFVLVSDVQGEVFAHVTMCGSVGLLSASDDETDAVSVAPPSDDRFLTAPAGHRLSIFHKWYLTGVSRRLAQ